MKIVSKGTKSEPLIPKTVKEKERELSGILDGDSGIPIVGIQVGDVSVNFSIPIEPVSRFLKSIGISNRTIVDLNTVKISVDISK